MSARAGGAAIASSPSKVSGSQKVSAKPKTSTAPKSSGGPASKEKAAKENSNPVVHQSSKYRDMILKALGSLKPLPRKGVSRIAIMSFLAENFSIDKEAKSASTNLKKALIKAVKDKVIIQVSGTGASGSFRLNPEIKTTKKRAGPTDKPAAKKETSGKQAKAADEKKEVPKKQTKRPQKNEKEAKGPKSAAKGAISKKKTTATVGKSTAATAKPKGYQSTATKAVRVHPKETTKAAAKKPATKGRSA